MEEGVAVAVGTLVPRTASVRPNASVAVAVAGRRSSGMKSMKRKAAVLLIVVLWIALADRAYAQSENPHVPVEITLSPKTAIEHPITGAVLLRPMEGAGQTERIAVSSLAPLTLKLPVGSTWEVTADLPGFWVPPQSLTVEASKPLVSLALELWPLGSISGVVKVKDKGIPLPKKLLVKTLAAPDLLKRPKAPAGALDCSVDEKGAWLCSLPAASFDLAISAEGLAPAYRWGVKVPAGKALSLGTIELERGASVAAWVAVEDGAIEPGRCIGRLTPLVAGGTSLESGVELGRTALEVEIRTDGFLQMVGLAPGTYALEVRQPGYPPIKIAPIRVDPGAETFLRDPILLKKPLDLAFEIVPPLDWLGRPWRAQVFRTTDRTARPIPIVFEGAADEAGRFIAPGQSSGNFKVDLLDSFGNRIFSTERQVNGPGDMPLMLEVRLITLEGRVRLGGEPLAATLWFGGRSGSTSVKMESDKEGWFHGVLPKAGLWRIEIAASEPRLRITRWEEVQAGRSDKASLNLELPDTRVFGHVIDERGKPVPRALVVLGSEHPEQPQETDEAGEFEFRGLPEGVAWLAAESRSQKSVSGRTFATLVDGREVGPVELQLRPVQRLTGRVSSPRGPVAGSQVTVLSRSIDGGGGSAMTSTDGSFTVEIPKASPRVIAIVSAPGFALRAFDAPGEGQSLALPVTEEGGRLEITFSEDGEDRLRKNLALAVLQNGLPIPASIFTQWAYDQGQLRDAADRRLQVPNVAPGEYRVCLVPRQYLDALAWASPPEGALCDSGLLVSGATLSLKLGLAR